jgi:hypothetical protein
VINGLAGCEQCGDISNERQGDNTFSRLRKNLVYTQNTVEVFSMTLPSK